MLSLQTLAKKALAKQSVPEEYHYILKYCGLWWQNKPIHLCDYCNYVIVNSTPFKGELHLDVALIMAIKENNHDLIRLFTEWGANIYYGLSCARTEYTQELCRKLGAKDGLDKKDIFISLLHHKTSNNIILCHEIFNKNPMLEILNMQDFGEEIHRELKHLIFYILDNVPINTLNKYWYAIAVKYKLKRAISFFYQTYDHLNMWRLMCAISFNNVFDLHEIYEQKIVHMDIDKMMHLACMEDDNFLTIYYCFVLGADIDQAINVTLWHHQTNNLCFCKDLKDLKEQNGLTARPLLLPNITDPKKIYTMLKNYLPISSNSR
uniref:Protein MGF 360-8L n=2 Tax=African swine fever virus (isolate Pig/Kenya/KEN-50/1950) TaxID=561445 RepID=3608L_ASFK5|nr:RecName: Full=Protein MGF 360-8L [African swine fever virus pig/Kenya/KEN-50/1950]P0C9P1.1 RecName: Full=Protein MGF 360-9L [African swine fever virus pig/Kenya/KEN-50/1950]